MGVVNWVLHIPKSIYKNTEEMFFQDVNPESIEIMRSREIKVNGQKKKHNEQRASKKFVIIL